MEGEKKIKEEIEGCSFKPELNAMTKKIISGEVVKMQKVSKVGGGREGGGEGGARTDGDATADSFRRRSSRTWEAISPCVFHSFLADSDDGEAAARVMLEDRFGVVVDDCCFG